MIKFVGEHRGKVDDKGRLIFPSPFKSLLPVGESQKFIVKKSLFTDSLDLFTYEEWVKESEQVRSRLNTFNKEHNLFWREYMRDRAEIIPDGKLGRITIPKHLLERIGVIKEVVFFGNDYKIELWSKEAFDASPISEEQFVSLAEKVLG